MLRNYFKITLRNLWKQKVPTAINVLGLALGIASAIIIFFIVQYELSFDTFHPKADRIYRITSTWEREGETYYDNTVPKPLPEAFRQDFAGDIEGLCILETTYKQLIRLNGQTTSILEPVAFTQNEYFSFLNIPLKAGNPKTILRRPGEVILSETLSNKLFGSVDQALGQDFTFIDSDSSYQLEVTGVMQNPPQNTDFNFEMLISFNTKEQGRDYYWDFTNSAFNVFVLLPELVDLDAFSNRLNTFYRKYAGDEAIKANASLLLQPLRELHYDDRYQDFGRKMAKENLAGLVFLAVLLVLMACVNFVNLTTAISTRRNKEVGIRKTLGSSRGQIVLHFLGEALLVTLTALVLALGLAELGLMQLKKLYTYLNPVMIQFSWSGIAFLLLLTILVTNIAGFYPGWLLSRFKPVQMFRTSGIVVRRQRFSRRQGLVVFQFFISQVFIVGTLIISQQLDFLENAPLGFNEQAIITVDLKDKTLQNRERFSTMLNGTAGIEDMAFSASTAMSQNRYGGVYQVDGETEMKKQVELQFADEHFFEMHDMPLLAGNVFTPSDSGSGFVVNEAFMHDLGLQQPEQALGKYISVLGWGFDLPIVGVVADYHTKDFRQKIAPLVITNFSPQYGSLSIKADMAQAESIISKLEEIWKLTYPEYDFSYAFLDDRVAGFYEDYHRNFSLAQVFASIAIFIGCLGLYGLVLFMAERKTKEIGIRKVLGASVRHIVGFFSKEFVKLVFIAFVLAAPLAYYLMQQWLQNFAYKIEIGVFIFCRKPFSHFRIGIDHCWLPIYQSRAGQPGRLFAKRITNRRNMINHVPTKH